MAIKAGPSPSNLLAVRFRLRSCEWVKPSQLRPLCHDTTHKSRNSEILHVTCGKRECHTRATHRSPSFRLSVKPARFHNASLEYCKRISTWWHIHAKVALPGYSLTHTFRQPQDCHFCWEPHACESGCPTQAPSHRCRVLQPQSQGVLPSLAGGARLPA